VTATIYTHQLSEQMKLALQKYTAQYPPIALKTFTHSHDRFLLIDDVVYHIGASLKDLGKKRFAFSKMQLDGKELIIKLNKISRE
jgi:hypothetical protein